MISTSGSLDILHFPLKGERLIEASAGTGKTYTISAFYLRLLLNIGKKTCFSRPLSVEEILVVTFTEAATKELKNRIFKNICEFRMACLQEKTNNLLYMNFFNEIKDKRKAAQWLLVAENKIDKASIFSIHGFCQRILYINPFDSNILFEETLIEDESTLYRQACIDFWHQYFSPLPNEISEELYNFWKGPEDLLRSINLYLQREDLITKLSLNNNESISSYHNKIIEKIISIKKKWCESVSEINKVINFSDINRYKFNRSNQLKWIEEINFWAQDKVHSYCKLPNALKKFTQCSFIEKTITKGKIPQHPLFIEIEELLDKPLILKNLIISNAIKEIRKVLKKEKRQRSELSFNDILSRLDQILNDKDGDKLSSFIRQRYPIAIIDEFQDTDPQQYRIFRNIWYHQLNTALLLIGDPKQAIYTFRGADIFTYIKARREIKKHYTLNINWRSSSGMVSSINTLFNRIDNVFMFQEIPFKPTYSAEKNNNLRFELCGKTLKPMCFWLLDNKTGSSIENYKTYMAQHCALQIKNWITFGLRGKALLYRGDKFRSVMSSDIVVLVRNYQEALLMKNALTLLNISSVYFSNRENIFKTLEAQEILWLLQAILIPKQKYLLRRALASSMCGLNIKNINNLLNTNKVTWNKIIKEFNEYFDCWEKQGVMAMLRNFIFRRHIVENIMKTLGGKRKIANILHISELLQEKSNILKSKIALVLWLEKRIVKSINNVNTQQTRIENDKYLIKIFSIHKSKGLEHSLVWLPFIASFRMKNESLYYNHFFFRNMLDFKKSKENMNLIERERLSEDLRLLYVALTRSIWHCSIGIAALFLKKGKKQCNSDVHQSALGKLIQKGKEQDSSGLKKCLKELCNQNISLRILNESDVPICPFQEPKLQNLHFRKAPKKFFKKKWTVADFVSLKKNIRSISLDIPLKLDLDCNSVEIENDRTSKLIFTPHQFPQGISSGTFLHSLLKEIDFSQPINGRWISYMLEKNGFNKQWKSMLINWMFNVIQTPLIEIGLSLSKIPIKEKKVEMEFCLPIFKSFTSKKINEILSHYDSISKESYPLDFCQMKGMLKGFIDLVFRHNGRYYLLDYKSDWLGENNEDYSIAKIIQLIKYHRYDFQYNIYTLALHRYLCQRIVNYNYEIHFGGVIYLFLRGLNLKIPHHGIFITRPKKTLIEKMDNLFSNR